MKMETECDIQRTLDPVDANLAIALSRVPVAATELCTIVEDRQINAGTGAKLSHVQVAAKRAWRPCSEGAILSPRHAHDSEERSNWNDGRRERMCGFAVELPVEKIWFAKALS
jgi:hypothetical protein